MGREEPWIPAADVAALAAAVEVLEHPGFLVRLAEAAGRPVERLVQRLADRFPGGGAVLRAAVTRALHRAADVAVWSLGEPLPRRPRAARERWHRMAVTVAGAAGGAAGLPGLLVELPVTTVLLLRAIADVAREEGEDLSSPGARLACLEVFALGGPRPEDDAVDSAYLAVRLGLAEAIQRAAAEGTAGRAVAALLARIAPRYEAAALEKAVAQAAPVVGALTGAAVNRLFVSHFQRLARAHFTVRRLERVHGTGRVRTAYRTLARGDLRTPGR